MLSQIMEASAIPGGALPFLARCCIILYICSGSITKATIRISEPHFSQIRGFILYTSFIRQAQEERFAFPFTLLLLDSFHRYPVFHAS